jgi:hypothetical protein
MGEVSRPAKLTPLVLIIGIVTACGFGAPSTFTLDSASVDQSYVCPAAANDLTYAIHAAIDARNGTSSTVQIRSVSAVLTLASIKGGWLEHVGEKYDASGITFSPNSVGAGNTATVKVVIPSTCTNGKLPSSGASYGDYSVTLTVATSSGTHTIVSQNRHRIVAA